MTKLCQDLGFDFFGVFFFLLWLKNVFYGWSSFNFTLLNTVSRWFLNGSLVQSEGTVSHYTWPCYRSNAVTSGVASCVR